MKKIAKFLSYVLVAALASAATMALGPRDPGLTKLEELQQIIEHRSTCILKKN